MDLFGLVVIGNRLRCLINWLVSVFYKFKYFIINCLVKIYGLKVNFNRGLVVVFNLFD